MVRVDLITGFLGAGKTTFLRGYLKYLQEQGERVRIIENEFGEVDVDSQLLADEHAEIADLTGLCMCCIGKEAFIKLLIASSRDHACDRIVVEPSGIYDVDEFFEVMTLPQVAECCEIGSIITIADPMGIDYLAEEAQYLLFAQLLASGVVIMSKTQFLQEAELEAAVEKYHSLMRKFGCENGLISDLCIKPWSEFTEDDYEEFSDAFYHRMIHDREEFSHGDTFRSTAVIAHAANLEDLKSRVCTNFNSPSCGWIYRIKGYVQTKQGTWYEVNCTGETESIRPVPEAEDSILVVIGQNLREREIKEMWK